MLFLQNRRLRHNLPLIMLEGFFGSLRLFYPVSIVVFETVTGSYALGMSVFAIAAFALALFEIPTGILSDKWGRKNTLILGTLAELMAVTCYLLSFYTTMPLVFLYTGAALFGLGSALFSGNNYALIYETLASYRKLHKLPHILGRMQAFEQVALGLTGIFAAILLGFGFEFTHLLGLTLIPLSLSVVCACLLQEPSRHVLNESKYWDHLKDATRLLVRNPRLRALAMASSVNNGMGQAGHSFLPGFINSVWPLWLTPLYRTAQNFIGALSFHVAGPVIETFGAMRTLMSGTIVSNILTFIGLVLANMLSPLFLMCTQVSYALNSTADHSLQQYNFTDEQRATMGSLISFMGAILGGIASVLLGLLADMLGPANALLILLFASLPATWIYFSLFKRDRRVG